MQDLGSSRRHAALGCEAYKPFNAVGFRRVAGMVSLTALDMSWPAFPTWAEEGGPNPTDGTWTVVALYLH